MSGTSEECQDPDDQMVPLPHKRGGQHIFIQFSEILIFNLLKTRPRRNFTTLQL